MTQLIDNVCSYEAATGFAAAAGAFVSATIPLFACFRAIFIARCFMYSLSNTPSHSDPGSPVSCNLFLNDQLSLACILMCAAKEKDGRKYQGVRHLAALSVRTHE